MHTPVEFYRHCLGPEELASITETLSSIFLTVGPRTAYFEEKFAEYLAVPHVVGVNSCSNGLILVLRALGIGPGDEVITTPQTFTATSNAILHVGATCVFADVERSTGLLDVESVRRKVTPRTKAIMPVHLYGQLCDMRAFRALADEHQLRLIEDCAHAVESRRDDVRSGQLGDAAVFSFYATKNVTCGDGGAIAVFDSALATRLKSLRNHGITKDAATRYGQRYTHWDMTELGSKCAMKDIEAALLIPQIAHIEERRELREALVDRYTTLFADAPDVELLERRGTSAHHLMTILVPAEKRDALLAGLGDRKIGCAVNYRAVHTLKYYRERFNYQRDDFPNAAQIGERTVSLPLWPLMPPEHVEIVARAVVEVLRDASGSPLPSEHGASA